MKATIRTYSGQYLDLLDPDPDKINIDDIAHALSVLPRFTGHTIFPYTVAQHSLWCYKNVFGPELGYQALMHDAAEAYVNDLASPLKKNLSKYQMVEGFVWSVIAAKFDLPERLHPRIKEVDQKAFKHEYFWLDPERYKPTCGLRYEHFSGVKKQFLRRFHKLTEGRFKEEQITKVA